MPSSFIHPLDHTLSEKLLRSAVSKTVLDAVFANDLDRMNHYLYSTSCMRLDEESPVHAWVLEGCRLFGLDVIPEVYVMRSYFYDITCAGLDKPILCIPDVLLQRGDADILRGRVMAATAAIKAGHHRLWFLSWVYDNFQSLLTIPFLKAFIHTVKNEWYRSQFFTLDRAFFLATGDRALTLKNILYGQTSFEMLKNLSFGTDDPFLRQVQEFQALDSAADFVALLSSYFQEESWLPERYSQIMDFWKEG